MQKKFLKMSKKKKSIALIIAIVMMMIISLSASYAVVSSQFVGTKNYSLTIGTLDFELKNEANSIRLNNAYPMVDGEGLSLKPYTFTLTNTGTLAEYYKISLLEDVEQKNACTGCTFLDPSMLRYSLTVDGVAGVASTLFSETVLEIGKLEAGVSKNYELRLWLNQDATVAEEGKYYFGRIKIDASQESYEPKPSEPVLGDNMIPVTIAANGEVTKADANSKWYDYSKQEWANAIILSDKSITYNNGDVIPEENIEGYFVWIPRYRYKIFNDGNYSGNGTLNPDAPQTIEIEFESKNTPVSSGTTVGEWLTHPAFTAFDTNGIWVGKFESGYKGATSTTEAEVSTADSSRLVVKSNTYSWRNINIGNMFKVSYDYKRDLESHMMKNTEWGAVAYLSHSKYGKQDETGKNTEVYINNNSNYTTGCGGDTASAGNTSTCLNAYGSKENNIYNQSTTGNVTGIFDMSGGAFEYVMGYNEGASTVGGSSGITNIYSDFFTNEEWNKYYDKYNSSSNKSYSSRILGDATGEMGPFSSNRGSWYGDYAFFVDSSYPWFDRGGLSGGTSDAGVFRFNDSTGGSSTYFSFRLVLSSSN